MISKIIMINSSMNRSNRLKISLPKISEFISSFVKADPMEANSTSWNRRYLKTIRQCRWMARTIK